MAMYACKVGSAVFTPRHAAFNSTCSLHLRRPALVGRLQAVIGIDLGTTNSAVAIVADQGPKVIPDAFGNQSVPSIVVITEDDELIVGTAAAAAQADAGPTNTFSSFKRLMGQKLNDVEALAAEQLSYAIFEGDKGECLIYSQGVDDLISPEELSTWLLQHLKHQVESHMKETVSGAVVAVPAHFNQRQRGATLAAAEAAGLGTVHLLQEPVAAALAYGINGGTDGETVLVFDVGGGTYDVSVLQAFEGIMQVLGTGGDSRLGGDDFDALIADWIQAQCVGCERTWALEAARAAKEQLSQSDCAVIHTPSENGSGIELNLTREIFEEISKGMFRRMAEVLDRMGRELFVEWATPPLEIDLFTGAAAAAAGAALSMNGSNDSITQQQDNIQTTTNSTNISTTTTTTPPPLNQGATTREEGVNDQWAPPPRRITRVALVGQITRLPSVRSFVERLTGVAPCLSVDPGEAVALGAATHAGILLGSVGSVELMDGSFVGELHSRVTGFGEWQP